MTIVSSTREDKKNRLYDDSGNLLYSDYYSPGERSWLAAYGDAGVVSANVATPLDIPTFSGTLTWRTLDGINVIDTDCGSGWYSCIGELTANLEAAGNVTIGIYAYSKSTQTWSTRTLQKFSGNAGSNTFNFSLRNMIGKGYYLALYATFGSQSTSTVVRSIWEKF